MSPRLARTTSSGAAPRPFRLALVAALLVAAAGAAFAQARPILIDGLFDDWDGLAPAATDATGDAPSGGIDFGRVWISGDDAMLYVRFEVGRDTIIQNPASGAAGNAIELLLDGDDNAATGLATDGMGADLVIGFGDKTGTWHRPTGDPVAMSLNRVGLLVGPTHSSTVFEVAIPFSIRPPSSSPVAIITGSTVNLRLRVVGGDAVPNSGSISFTWSRVPPPAVEAIPLGKMSPHDLRVLVHNVQETSPLSNPDPFRRLVAATRPDIVAWSEAYNLEAEDVVAFVEAALGETGTWHGAKQNDCVTVSRHPIIHARGIANTSGGFDGNLATYIDLPDDRWPFDLVLFNAHTPCCNNNAGRDHEHDRISRTWRDLMAGTGPFPIGPRTAAIMVGDFNMVGYARQLRTLRDGDLINNGLYGVDFAPARSAGAMTALAPRHTHRRLSQTWRSFSLGSAGSAFVPGRLDWVIATGDVLLPRRHYILDTNTMTAGTLSAAGLLAGDSNAADHLPIIADFAPIAMPGFLLR